MNMERLQEQLKNAADEETEPQVEKSARAADVVKRRIKNLLKGDYEQDEAILGAAMALADIVQETSGSEREAYIEIICRIMKM